MFQIFWKAIKSIFPVALLVGAIFLLHRELHSYHYQDLLKALAAISSWRILGAGVLVLTNYWIFSKSEGVALAYVRVPIKADRVMLVAFLANAFANVMSVSGVAGAAIRFRLYSEWGLAATDITKVIFVNFATLWLGVLILGGVVFVIFPQPLPMMVATPWISTTIPLGFLLLMILGAYVGLMLIARKVRWFQRWKKDMPSVAIMVKQLLLGAADWLTVGTLFYVLLPSSAPIAFTHLLPIFLLAQIVGLISTVPGGLGIFEVGMLAGLSGVVPAAEVMAALFLYRVVYYILPFTAAAFVMALGLVLEKRRAIGKVTKKLVWWFPLAAPHVLSLSIFLGGVVLLFSGATPEETGRLLWLRRFIPLPVIEFSHFFGSVFGVALIILARGLQRRLDAAYVGTLFILSGSIVVSLFKGFDFEEALVLSVMLVALLLSKPYFYRKASFFHERFTWGWSVAVATVLASTFWLGFFAYKHVEYSDVLWWQFSLHGNAPRFLRASVGAVLFVLIFALAKLFRGSLPFAAGVHPAAVADALPVVRDSTNTNANLALMGDKGLVFSDNKKAFIQFGISEKSLVAMGDPIGPEDEWEALIWKFREMCDEAEKRTVFYEVGERKVSSYLDMGLSMVKIGEEARVKVDEFTLEGPSRSEFRKVKSRFEREGATFEVIPAEKVTTILPEIRIISDLWLAKKKTKEKGFSLGFFNEAYLRHFPCAIVRLRGEIVAFSNLWIGAQKQEISVDLMRYDPSAPFKGLMDALFLQILLYAKGEGFAWFRLGMAPLSGLANRPLAPLWHRIGSLVYRHADDFYNFQGLRSYKEKFDPVWEARYLAYPGGFFTLPRVLLEIASLNSGGLKGVFTK